MVKNSRIKNEIVPRCINSIIAKVQSETLVFEWFELYSACLCTTCLSVLSKRIGTIGFRESWSVPFSSCFSLLYINHNWWSKSHTGTETIHARSNVVWDLLRSCRCLLVPLSSLFPLLLCFMLEFHPSIQRYDGSQTGIKKKPQIFQIELHFSSP